MRSMPCSLRLDDVADHRVDAPDARADDRARAPRQRLVARSGSAGRRRAIASTVARPGVVDVSVVAADLLPRHHRLGVEVLDLAGDLGRRLDRVERGDPRDPAAAVDERVPERWARRCRRASARPCRSRPRGARRHASVDPSGDLLVTRNDDAQGRLDGDLAIDAWRPPGPDRTSRAASRPSPRAAACRRGRPCGGTGTRRCRRRGRACRGTRRSVSTATPAVCASASTMSTPGMIGRSGKVAGELRLVGGHLLDADRPLARLELDDPVDEQERDTDAEGCA